MQLDFDLRGTPAPRKPAVEKEKPAEALSVTALTRRIRQALESSFTEVVVEGEVSNLRRQASGHVYFTLKDPGASLPCVLFASQASRLAGIAFENGRQVRVTGRIGVYEPRGVYQLVARKVEECGFGSLQARFEELKKKLHAEGLFDSARKRPLPEFPRLVAVVTSPTGAAIRDFLHVLHRRQRGIAVMIHPVRVQGKGAAEEIAEALDFLGRADQHGLERPDVIVVTRGGGSMEDLWEFNEEVVARAIAASPVPVVSAVGHEIDVTIADFAADRQAPTPSAAAEILSADVTEVLGLLHQMSARLQRPVRHRLEQAASALAGLRRTALFLEPRRMLDRHRQTLDRCLEDLAAAATLGPSRYRLDLERHARTLAIHNPRERLADLRHTLATASSVFSTATRQRLASLRQSLAAGKSLLDALSPAAALRRGYTITSTPDGTILRSRTAAREAGTLVTRFSDGTVSSHVADGG
jgi:exodeoxyribonuclease VII large subunit